MKSRWRRLVAYLVYLLVSTFVLGEIIARSSTRKTPDGVGQIGRFALVPYRPDAESVSAWLKDDTGGDYLSHDEFLGWTIVPNGHGKLYTANAQGIRAEPDRIYTPQLPPDTVRIVTVGDSFTHCDDVTNDQTWQHYLQRAQQNWQVINLGVPGYGTDQAFLRWRQLGSKFQSHVVILGIWPENICRNLNIMRYYLAPLGGYASKPRFRVTNGSLDLVNSPVTHGEELVRALSQPESFPLLSQDYWYDPELSQSRLIYRSRLARLAATLFVYWQRREARARIYDGTEPSGIDLTAAIAEQFAREVDEMGAIPVVLILPMRTVAETFPEEDSFPLVRALHERKLCVVDTGPSMLRMAKERDREHILPRHGHLPPLGNELLSKEISRALVDILAASKDNRAAM